MRGVGLDARSVEIPGLWLNDERKSGKFWEVLGSAGPRRVCPDRVDCPSLGSLCVTRSAEDQRMRDPPEELSVRLGSNLDGLLEQSGWPKLRANPE